MVWTYCTACGLRTEWATLCSRCGSANPLYGLSVSDRTGGETKPAGLPGVEDADCRAVMRDRDGAESSPFRQLWHYIAGVLLVSLITLAVILVMPLVLR